MYIEKRGEPRNLGCCLIAANGEKLNILKNSIKREYIIGDKEVKQYSTHKRFNWSNIL